MTRAQHNTRTRKNVAQLFSFYAGSLSSKRKSNIEWHGLSYMRNAFFFKLAKFFSFVMNFPMAFLIVFIGTEGCRYFVSCRSSEITRYRYVLCVAMKNKWNRQKGNPKHARIRVERRAANRLSCWHVWMSLVIRVLAYVTQKQLYTLLSASL